MDDSIRNERVRMRTADLALCYQQDSTVMAQKVFIREKENEVLELRQKSGVCIKIVDNGGGYRPNSSNRGTGTGMKVIMQTIQILNMNNKEKIDVSVHNVSLPSGETGCEVTFQLPDKYNYKI